MPTFLSKLGEVFYPFPVFGNPREWLICLFWIFWDLLKMIKNRINFK